MNELLGSLGGGPGWLPIVLDISFKTAVILISALALTHALRASSASVRHHVWTLAFAAVLALPLLTASVPAWKVTLPGWTTGPVLSSPEVAPPVEALATAPIDRPDPVRFTGDRSPVEAAAGAPSSGLSPLALLLGVWACGAFLLFARLSVGVVSAWWTTRMALPVTDVGWTRRVEEVAHELGVRRPVRVVQSPWVGTPMAWGILRPTLLLPPEASAWSSDRRRAVVLHEMAHIRRRDCLVHLVAQAARAVHWVNPLAWIGTKRLRAERERACDDLVLVSGTRSADYAKLLLDVARCRGDRRLAWATVSMAQSSELEGRLLAILDPARDRRGVGRPGALAALALTGALVVPLAAFQASPTPSPLAVPGPVAPAVVGLATGGVTVVPALSPDATSSVASPSAIATPEPASRPVPGIAARARATAIADSRIEVSSTLMVAPLLATDTLETRVLDALLRALQSDREDVRSQAAYAIGKVESTRGVPALSAALSTDGSEEVRRQAAWALGMIESPDAVASLLGALSEASADIRSNAAWALGMIESPDAVEGLIGTLGRDASPKVRAEAAWALGMIEDPRATDALIDAIEDEDEDVAENAIWALGRVLGNS